MTAIILKYWRLGIVIALMLASATTGWYIESIRWEADTATVKANNEQALKAISDAATKALQNEQGKQQALQKQLAELDQKRSQELTDAQATNNKLRSDVAAGTRKLRIAAKCPANTNQVPNTSTTGSMGDATTVELSAFTGQDIFDIRSGIITDTAKLKYLQDYISTQQGVSNAK